MRCIRRHFILLRFADCAAGGDDPAAVYRQHRFIVTTSFLNYAAGTVSFGVSGQPLRVINRHTVPPARTVRLNAPDVTAHTCASSSRVPSYTAANTVSPVAVPESSSTSPLSSARVTSKVCPFSSARRLTVSGMHTSASR